MPSASVRIAGACERRVFPQQARGVPQIPAERVERGNAAALPVLLLDDVDAAQLHQCVAARLGWCHTGAQVVVDVTLQVAVELFAEIPLEAPPEQARQTQPRHAKDIPARCYQVSLGARNRARISVVCSHSFASRAICFRPAFVSR